MIPEEGDFEPGADNAMRFCHYVTYKHLPDHGSDKRENYRRAIDRNHDARAAEISGGLTTVTSHPRGFARTRMPERILVAMSGGVDSSVAALLLKQQGHDVVGAYMKNWINEDNVVGDCPWQQDIEDARAVAEHIGIEFRVVNLMREYRERIVDYLLDGYARGLTPNPDIMCNREIKFGVFRAWARDNGFDAVATGHYARRMERLRSADCGSRIATRAGSAPAALPDLPSDNPQSAIRNLQLFEGADKNKDQSYFLALLSQEQLRDARFPDRPSAETRTPRDRARQRNFPRQKKRTAREFASSAK